MMIRRTITAMTTLCVAAALLASCSKSPRVTFYTLNADATPGATTPAKSLESVAIGPVTLPDLLDRPQLVVRIDANRVDILEIHRWAAPLKSEIPRIIAEDLTILLKPVRVSAYPQSAGMDADYKVLVDIQRFEMTAGIGVSLEALWSLRRTEGGASIPGHSVIQEPADGDSYDALVAAYGRALAAVSRDIAHALRVEDSAQH